MRTFFKNYWGVLIVFFLSFWAIMPLFSPGFFPIHDNTQVERVFQMGKALSDGMFPVRWVADLGYGYGYPIFNFYAPFSYYFGGFLTLFGLNALIATKIMMAAGILLAGLFMYLLAREFWGEVGGIISSLFYVYAPYHALDIYVRGDVAEFWAYGFIPLMFFGFYMVYKNSNDRDYLSANSKLNPSTKLRTRIQSSKLWFDKLTILSKVEGKFRIKNIPWKWVLVGSFGYAGVILSHNLTAMMVTPFLVIALGFLIYKSYKNKKIHNTYYLILTAILGLMLSAFYWIPALTEMGYTNVLSQIGGGADFRDHFVCINQLWQSNWGFGGSAPGCVSDGMSFMIGKLHIVFFISTLVLSGFMLLHVITRYNEKIKESAFVALLSIIGFLISVFLMLDVSRWAWEILDPMEFFQFPWRFLIMVLFFSSFLAGFVFWSLKQFDKNKIYRNSLYSGAILTVVVLLFFNLKFFKPQIVIPKLSEEFTAKEHIRWTASKISDEYMPQEFQKPVSDDNIVVNKIAVDKDSGAISNLAERTQNISAIINLNRDSLVHVNLAHFPAWNFYIDDERTNFDLSTNGYNLYLTQGAYKIEIRFEQTLIEKTANIISVTGIAIVSIGIIISRKKRFTTRE